MLPKTKDAFAFRDFDHNKFLQRPLFKFVEVDGEYFLKNNLRGDGEIFESLSPTDDVNKNENHLKKLQVIYDSLVYYQVKLIDDIHLSRLIRFKRATKNLELKKRAGELQEKYDEYANIIAMIQDTVRKKISTLEKTIEQQTRKIFASRLKQARTAAGLTQKALANAVNMSQNGFQQYEGARREPSLTTLTRLSKVLGQSADWLLGIGT